MDDFQRLVMDIGAEKQALRANSQKEQIHDEESD